MIIEILFCADLLITFPHYYYAKSIILASIIWMIFFRVLFYRKVLNFNYFFVNLIISFPLTL